MQIEANRDCLVAVGSTEEIMEALFGPAQHDEHCRGWRWHLYVRDADRGMEAVRAEIRKMREERQARIEILRRKADVLEAREYIEEHVDVVDGSYGQPEPNRAMVLVSMIDESLHGPGGF